MSPEPDPPATQGYLSSAGVTDADMNVAVVRVWPAIRTTVEVVAAAPQMPAVDDVLRRWVTDHRLDYGDRIHAARVHVNGMNEPATVWVVVTNSGAVRCVSDPPVGRPVPGGPDTVYLAPKATQ